MELETQIKLNRVCLNVRDKAHELGLQVQSVCYPPELDVAIAKIVNPEERVRGNCKVVSYVKINYDGACTEITSPIKQKESPIYHFDHGTFEDTGVYSHCQNTGKRNKRR